jgi:hypothetical protein
LVERETRGKPGHETKQNFGNRLTHEEIVRGVRDYIRKEQSNYNEEDARRGRVPTSAELIRERLDRVTHNWSDLEDHPRSRLFLAWDIATFDNYRLKSRAYGRSLANLTNHAQGFQDQGQAATIQLAPRESLVLNALAEAAGMLPVKQREFTIPEKLREGWNNYWYSPEHQKRFKAAGFNPNSEACDI